MPSCSVDQRLVNASADDWMTRSVLASTERPEHRMSPARWWGLCDAFPGVAQASTSSPTR